MFFTLWVLLWNVGRIYFLVFSVQNIKSNREVIFHNFSPIIFFRWVIGYISFQLYLFVKDLIFLIPSRFSLLFSRFKASVTAYWKYFLSFLLIGFIVAFLYFIQSGESMYDPPRFGFFYDIFNTTNEHNQRLPLIDVSNPIWYLEKRKWKVLL